MVIFIILAVVAFGVAAYYFLKGFWLLGKAVYYRWFASEKVLDEAMKSEIFAKGEDYKAFENKIDNLFRD